jgi:hypothetical protein
MKHTRTNVIVLLAIMSMITLAGIVYADTGVKAVPEIQGIATSTSSNVAGTVTEMDSGAWSLTNDPLVIYSYDVDPEGLIVSPDDFNSLQAQLQAAGGSLSGTELGLGVVEITHVNVPQSLLNTLINSFGGYFGGMTWQDYLSSNSAVQAPVITDKGLHTGVLDPGQVQYTAGYNDQYTGVSGQQTFSKSLALSTANTIADQSNLKANTNIQFIAMDTGRATRSEDLLLDGAAQAQDSSSLILCPFANANPGIIPAFCNIEQAGSAFDTTLTSTVTSADTRFVGTGATIPVVLNYNINSQGITLSDGTSSPMIGSVSAYLKVHVQEARNESTMSGELLPGVSELFYSFPDGSDPQKSEDLAYSETSTASGLISRFSKSMSYSSQGSAVAVPPTITPVIAPVG